ncbi:MAG: hypothetical protein ACI4QT_06145 [Kiritimatiellia bacterium]
MASRVETILSIRLNDSDSLVTGRRASRPRVAARRSVEIHPYPGFSEFDGAMVRENCLESPIRPSCPNLCP